MIEPFIFLDIDGVLNGHKRHPNGYAGLDAEPVRLLNEVLEKTKAKVIVSSAWRYFVLRGEMTIQGLTGLLCTHGLKWGCVVDVLPADIPDGKGGADRGAAIEQWFVQRYCVSHSCKYVVLDDLDLGYSERNMPFVQTDPSIGLTIDLANKAISHL